MKIELTADEGMAAATVGILQMMRATRKGWVGNDHGGASGRDMRERWAQSIHGAMAECAACKALGLFWASGISGIAGSDVCGIEVRATPWENGCLIINHSDIEKHFDHPFILVTGHWPSFKIRGWLTAGDAQQDEWYRQDERPASWWVPQSALRPLRELTLK